MSEAANTHRIRLLDSTLRDGSHGIRHRYTPQQVELIAGKLDEAGVHSIGVGHGDGLGASSIQYMRSLHTDDELLTAARRVIKRARLAVTFQPGIGTKQQLERAAGLEGATLADACLAGAGAGAGNCQLEALVAVMEKAGMGTGIDLWTLEDIADQVVRPIMTTPPIVDRATLTQGFAGVPGSFLHHAFSAAERFGVDARDILVEVGRRKSVGGQEDLVIEVAARLAATERPAAS